VSRSPRGDTDCDSLCTVNEMIDNVNVERVGSFRICTFYDCVYMLCLIVLNQFFLF